MADYAALRSIWPEGGGSLEAKLNLINSMQVPGPVQDIPVKRVRGQLQSRPSQLPHLETYALMARTRDIRRHLGMPGIPQSIVSATYLLQLLSSEGAIGKHRLPVLKSLLSDLVADEASGIEQADMDAVMALFSSTIPWWQKHGFSQPVGIYDAIEAQLS
jgi:hypothetical protein